MGISRETNRGKRRTERPEWEWICEQIRGVERNRQRETRLSTDRLEVRTNPFPPFVSTNYNSFFRSSLPLRVCSFIFATSPLSSRPPGPFHLGSGNEPSYSGSTRKKLSSGSARELNKPSLSLNLGLINLGLGSARARLEKSSARAVGTHPSLERGFRLRSPIGRIWSSPVRSRLRRAGVKCPSHVSRIPM